MDRLITLRTRQPTTSNALANAGRLTIASGGVQKSCEGPPLFRIVLLLYCPAGEALRVCTFVTPA